MRAPRTSAAAHRIESWLADDLICYRGYVDLAGAGSARVMIPLTP